MHSSIHVTVRCDTCPLLGPVPSESGKIPFYTMLYLGIFLLGCLPCLATVASQDYTIPASWVSNPTLYDIRHDSNIWYQKNATSSLPLGEREQLGQDLVNALAMPSRDIGRCTSFRL